MPSVKRTAADDRSAGISRTPTYVQIMTDRQTDRERTVPSGDAPDLHGIKKQPFPSFDEAHTYLERVTVPDKAEATRLLAEEYLLDSREVELEEIFMHWVEEDDDFAAMGHLETLEWLPGWFECAPDSPGALPFWKEVV